MSRRRGPGSGAGVEQDGRVTVVCTDRGQHPSAPLGMLALINGELVEVGGRPLAVDPTQPALPIPLPPEAHARRAQSNVEHVDGRNVLRYACSRCGRDVPLRWDRAQVIVARFTEARMGQLDISAL